MIHKHSLAVNECHMERMIMSKIVYVWIIAASCLLVPAMAQDVVNIKLMSASSISDSATENLRTKPRNREEEHQLVGKVESGLGAEPRKLSSEASEFTGPNGQKTTSKHRALEVLKRWWGAGTPAQEEEPHQEQAKGPTSPASSNTLILKRPIRASPTSVPVTSDNDTNTTTETSPVAPPSPASLPAAPSAPISLLEAPSPPASSPAASSSPTSLLAAPSSPASSPAARSSPTSLLAAPSSPASSPAAPSSSVSSSAAPSVLVSSPISSVAPSSVTPTGGGIEMSRPPAGTLTGYETPISSPNASPALSPASSPNLEPSAGAPATPIAAPITDDSAGTPTGNYVGTPQPFSNKLPVSIPPTPPPVVVPESNSPASPLTSLPIELPTLSPVAPFAPIQSPAASPVGADSAGTPTGNYVGTPQPFSNKLPVSTPPTSPPVAVPESSSPASPPAPTPIELPALSPVAPFAPIQSPAVSPVGTDFQSPL